MEQVPAAQHRDSIYKGFYVRENMGTEDYGRALAFEVH